MHAVIDLDLYKYHAAAAGEKRDVLVEHPTTGYSTVVKNRTEFYGHYLKKAGGVLAEINKDRISPYLPDEFVYTDRQHPEPIENVLHTAKVMVKKDLAASGATKWHGYIGEGDSWRVERSTILKYKGSRENLIKPLYLQEVSEYLKNKFNGIVVRHWEADEAIVMDCYKQYTKYAIFEDKDYWGCPINAWDINQPQRGIVNCNKFGHLFIDGKGKVRGEGRIWLYHQICSGDDVDCYTANSASDVKWGEKSSYNALKDCKSDDEAFAAMVGVYKNLYPVEKTITGWRGDSIVIDWKYVLEENFQMARMYRSVDDHVSIVNVLSNKGIL